MDTDIVSVLSDLVSNVGMWGVFAFLYISERKAHDKTRRHWNEDLREVAGLTKPLAKNPPAPLSEIED